MNVTVFSDVKLRISLYRKRTHFIRITSHRKCLWPHHSFCPDFPDPARIFPDPRPVRQVSGVYYYYYFLINRNLVIVISRLLKRYLKARRTISLFTSAAMNQMGIFQRGSREAQVRFPEYQKVTE